MDAGLEQAIILFAQAAIGVDGLTLETYGHRKLVCRRGIILGVGWVNDGSLLGLLMDFQSSNKFYENIW